MCLMFSDSITRYQDNRNFRIKHISHKETSVAKFKSAHSFPSKFYTKIDNLEYFYLFSSVGCCVLKETRVLSNIAILKL